jgi:tRNA(Leu) C34 or U34 (ribose-2'-O)-methylase TrmL
MKTVYSMREFHDGAKALAAKSEITQGYFTVSCEMGSFGDDDVKFRIYVHEFGSEQAKTPQECLEQMRNKILPIPQAKNEVDVLVEENQI